LLRVRPTRIVDRLPVELTSCSSRIFAGSLLLSLKLTAPSSDPTASFALVLRNGRRIETNWNFRDTDLARLIRIADSQ